MKKTLLLLLLATSVRATTYYVDNCVVTGNDSNNGTSTSTPWLTIAHVNVQTFNPGDSILFQRGCLWHEKLLPPSSGSNGSQITFADYGSGNKPILDGATAPAHWGRGGGAYALQDTFESGTYSSNWSSTQGSVNTWAEFGITGPTGGSSYGAALASAQQCSWNGANGTEYWFETWVQAGASATARTYVGQFGNGVSPIVAVMFSSSSDATPNRLRIYNYAAGAGSQEFYGTTAIAASTWYKVKARLVISSTAGEIDVWLNSGGGWSLEFAQSGVNTGSANITRVTMGYSGVASQTSYFDYFQIAATDPSLPATTYLFSTLTTNPLTSAPINLTRVWYGNNIASITEYPQNSGAGSGVNPGQWDITGSNAGLSSIVWVGTSGNIANVEWPTIDYDVRVYGQSYLTFQNLMFMRALVRGMNHGTNSQPSHNQILYCDFWDNNGSGSYVNKDGTIYGIDSYTFSHNTFYRNYLHTAATVYQGGSGHGVYCTKCTNTLIEYSDCQNNGNYCTQLQDASNYNTYRYSRSIGEQGLLSLTTDLIGGSTGNYIYDNISVNEYQCVIATSATGNYLYYNTFAGFSYRGFANNGGTFGTVENNIFWTTVPGAQVIFTSAGTGFTSNFNIYGAQQSNFIYSEGTYYSTLSAWGRAGAQDKTGDPFFAELAGKNVTLTSSSPAHNAGTDLSSTVPYGWSPISPLGFPPTLLSRSVLGKYDIGAFVYLPSGPGTLLGGSVTPGGIVTTK
jgi:hypothetical protein